MDVNKIGKAIKTLREHAGYTQAELAACLDITDKAVSKWERCLGIPDVSILAKLCNLLNTDIDNLLDGNITYLEHNWRGLLVIEKNEYEIYPDIYIQSKRLVEIPICYFLLAGIKDITILGNADCISRVRSLLGIGERLGITITYATDYLAVINDDSPTMVIHSNIFLYGLNLTRFFQRAISQGSGITSIVITKKKSDDMPRIFFDNMHNVCTKNIMKDEYYKVPIDFCHSGHLRFLNKTLKEAEIKRMVEPMGRGMIAKVINTWTDVSEVGSMIDFIERNTGELLYCPEEIAWRRGIISKQKMLEHINYDTVKGKYLLSLE